MRGWSRLLGACSLLTVLGGSLFTSHRHRNAIFDLLTDGCSDSGRFLKADDPMFGNQSAISGSAFVLDDPCAACLWQDYRASATVRFSLDVPVSILLNSWQSRESELPSVPRTAPIIRGPPSSTT